MYCGEADCFFSFCEQAVDRAWINGNVDDAERIEREADKRDAEIMREWLREHAA